MLIDLIVSERTVTEITPVQSTVIESVVTGLNKVKLSKIHCHPNINSHDKS